MTMITEIGDIKRFPHPRKLVSWIGKDVKARRKDTAPELISIADRCLRRLNKKGNRLLLAGKHPNKVKVACAREMVGYR